MHLGEAGEDIETRTVALLGGAVPKVQKAGV